MSVEAARRTVPPSWLNLAANGLYRDLRKLIYKKLDKFDRKLVEEAHMSSRKVTLDIWFVAVCRARLPEAAAVGASERLSVG